jgi:hypothetical protein
MWESIVEPDRPQMKIWRMRIVYWIPTATSHIQNMQYLLLCQGSGYKNSPEFYVIVYYMFC